MKSDYIFTSESVTEGHPDKLCDTISDAIVDSFLQKDPMAKVIAECGVSTSIVFIAARFASISSIDFSSLARKVITQAGYNQSSFNGNTCSIITSIKELPFDEKQRFDERKMTDEEIEYVPAKNQVTVFGYACKQTPAFMPLPIWLAHKLSRRLASVRFQKKLPYLAPDGKTQVAVEYKNRKPYRIQSITVLASQEEQNYPSINKLRDDIMDEIVKPIFIDESIKPDDKTLIFINPEGAFLIGGPSVHSGLTGRKNAIDTYGEYSRHSGSALSGKDPMRIDRTGAYAARYAAKNIVSSGLAEECEVQLSYSIGQSRPVSIQVESFGTGKINDEELSKLLERNIDFRPVGILKNFNLRYQPSLLKGGFYRKLAVYGHVGRMDIGLPWELTDKATDLLA
ncbi:MAG TPA: methionine adenosyltransferase [Nitrospirae bacterium]|nr:methionine adenosyltransferase [Nitrospirota bacterium]